VALAALLLGCGAALLPGWRVLRIRPVEALRAE
jgi:ABC-type lipoprotein release transport system permease subunit